MKKRTLKSKILSGILALCMVAGLLPLAAFAEEAQHTDSETITAVAAPEVAEQEIAVGSETTPTFPETVAATLTTVAWEEVPLLVSEGEVPQTEWQSATTTEEIPLAVEWVLPEGEAFSTTAPHTFTYTAVPKDATYALSPEISMPTFAVHVVAEETPTNENNTAITGFALPMPAAEQAEGDMAALPEMASINAAAVNETFTAIAGEDASGGAVTIGATMTFMVTSEDAASKTGTVQVGNGTGASIPIDTAGAVTIPTTVTRTVNGETYTYTVTAIGGFAFLECSLLTGVTIPNSVTSIGDGAFNLCGDLTEINVETQNPAYTDESGILFNREKSTLIKYPEGKTGTTYSIPPTVISIGSGAFQNAALTSVNIPNSVMSIGSQAFRNSALTSVIIPNSVTSIEGSTFAYCTSLSSVNIPNSVTSIGSQAFRNSALTSVIIPNSVTSIERATFADCTSLTSVTIPNGVTSIGDSAFSGTALSSVNIPNSVTSIGESAFQNTDLTSVTIPGSVTSIGDHTFDQCGSLRSVTIPNGVTSIGISAFADCTSLSSVTIPNSVTSIGNGAFLSTALTSVNIPNGVTSIEGATFNGCGSLSSVTIPSSVTRIGNDAFRGTALSSVTIPGSVASIGAGAFSGCGSLSSVTLQNGVTDIGLLAFQNNTALTSVVLPSSVTSMGDVVFNGSINLADIYFLGNMPTIAGGNVAPNASTKIYYPSLATGWDTYSPTTGVKTPMTSYTVTHTLTNMASNGGPYLINDARLPVSYQNYAATLTPSAGYALPQTIRVLMGGTALTSGYTYSAETGAFSITNSDITDNVEIIAQARPFSTETDITGFSLAGQVGASAIDTQNHTVHITLPHGADVSALSPTITLSPGASVAPASGTAQNFTNPVAYTVTAEDGTTSQVWTVTVALENAPPTMINGRDQIITQGQSASFTSSDDFGGYVDTVVTLSDGTKQTVHTAGTTNQNASAVEGSIILTLSGAYTATLPLGTHSIRISSANGSATANFTVVAAGATTPLSPQTGVY